MFCGKYMSQLLTSFDFALSYAHAFRVLLNKHYESRLSGNYQDFSLIVPLMSIGGFACELFMKSLVDKKLKTHKLYSDLYKNLDTNTSNEIETIVVQCMRLKKNKPDYDSLTFKSDFMKQDRLFEDFRYLYEPKKDKPQVVYNIDFTEVLVSALQTICELKFGKRPITEIQNGI